MNTNLKSLANKLVRDKNNKIVMGQFPNLPLFGWFLFMVAAYFIPAGFLKHGFEALSGAFLFVWAYLEISQGATYLRRLLGIVVATFIVASFFR